MPTRYKGSRSHYEHKYKAFGDEVLRAPWMRAQMHARAYTIMLTARRLSPIETGEYIESFEVTDGIRATGKRGTRRAYGRVTNTSDHAMAVEFGFGRTPRYRVLGKALNVIPGDTVAGA